MKKFLAIAIVTVALIIGCSHTAVKPADMTEEQLCSYVLEKAQLEDRPYVDADGNLLGKVLAKGTCSKIGCVLDEKTNKCGWIIQSIDLDFDDKPEVEVLFGPLVHRDTNEFAGWAMLDYRQVGEIDQEFL
jgi:hypothetical protein